MNKREGGITMLFLLCNPITVSGFLTMTLGVSLAMKFLASGFTVWQGIQTVKSVQKACTDKGLSEEETAKQVQLAIMNMIASAKKKG